MRTDNARVTTDLRLPAESSAVRRPRRTAGDHLRFGLQLTGELLITFGVLVLLFAVYSTLR